MKLMCLQCGHVFEGGISFDELGWHSACPACNGSFDVDAPARGEITVEHVNDYMVSVNLGNYDLDGVEITEDDANTILERYRAGNKTLEAVVEEYLLEIREVLDIGLENEEENV